MRRAMLNIAGNILLVLLIVLLLPMQAAAIPAITCHCFTDRSFDPARPAVADPYFLAATQNSFFAAVFKVDKKTIVMKKQQGASADDLWIAYLVASKTGASPEALLQAGQAKGSWSAVIFPLKIAPKSLGTRFSHELKKQSTTARLAEVVVDELFLRYQLLSEAELVAVRQAGASSQELIIATVLATSMKQPVRQIYLEVKGGSKTWGSLLIAARINPQDMQGEISRILHL